MARNTLILMISFIHGDAKLNAIEASSLYGLTIRPHGGGYHNRYMYIIPGNAELKAMGAPSLYGLTIRHISYR